MKRTPSLLVGDCSCCIIIAASESSVFDLSLYSYMMPTAPVDLALPCLLSLDWFFDCFKAIKCGNLEEVFEAPPPSRFSLG